MTQQPTIETYPELQRAFNFFNRHLFDGKLSSPLFTLESHVKLTGYFSKDKYVSSDGKHKTHQLAMNPACFHEYSVKVNLSTLVHVMCHQYQTEYGKETRRCYHDKQWSEFMTERGLIPSSTGLPGGKQTGQSMTHYIQEGGRFDVVADQLINEGFNFRWHDPLTFKNHQVNRQRLKARSMLRSTTSQTPPVRAAASNAPVSATTTMPVEPPEHYNSSNRVKYICITCSQQLWGKRGLKVLCASQGCDNRPFEAESDY